MTEKLIIKIKRNDRLAQRDFYFRYSNRIFLVVYRYLNSEQEAASVVNISFYKIFKNIQNFIYNNEKSLIAWMKKIATNEALLYLRQNQRFSNTDYLEDTITEEYLPEDKLLAEDYLNMIRELPADLRTVFNMYAIDGYTHKEIAGHLKINESSSRVYLSRARKILQSKLLDNGK